MERQPEDNEKEQIPDRYFFCHRFWVIVSPYQTESLGWLYRRHLLRVVFSTINLWPLIASIPFLPRPLPGLLPTTQKSLSQEGNLHNLLVQQQILWTAASFSTPFLKPLSPGEIKSRKLINYILKLFSKMNKSLDLYPDYNVITNNCHKEFNSNRSQIFPLGHF